MKKYKNNLFGKNGNPKLKHATLCNEYEQGGLQNVDIFSKITSLQRSWVKRLYDDSFHAWRVILLFLIKIHLGKKFVFHSNISVMPKIVKKFLKFHQEKLK